MWISEAEPNFSDNLNNYVQNRNLVLENHNLNEKTMKNLHLENDANYIFENNDDEAIVDDTFNNEDTDKKNEVQKRKIVWECGPSDDSQTSITSHLKSNRKSSVAITSPYSLPSSSVGETPVSFLDKQYRLEKNPISRTITTKTLIFNNGKVDEEVDVRSLSKRNSTDKVIRSQSTPLRLNTKKTKIGEMPENTRHGHNSTPSFKTKTLESPKESRLAKSSSPCFRKSTKSKDMLEYIPRPWSNGQSSRWKYLQELDQRKRGRIYMEQLCIQNGKPIEFYTKQDIPQYMEITRKISSVILPEGHRKIEEIHDRIKEKGGNIDYFTLKRGLNSPLEYGHNGITYSFIPQYQSTFQMNSRLFSKADFPQCAIKK